MNKKCRKLLLHEFEKLLRVKFSSFTIDKSATLPSGWKLYKLNWNAKATVFLVVCTSDITDEYTVEIAWSEKHRFPSHLKLMMPVDHPRCNIKRDEPQNGEFLFRIGSLLPSGNDFHWKASRKPGLSDPIDDLLSGDFDLGETPDEEYEDPELLKQSVRDTIDKFKDFVIPFLRDSLGEPTQ